MDVAKGYEENVAAEDEEKVDSTILKNFTLKNKPKEAVVSSYLDGCVIGMLVRGPGSRVSLSPEMVQK